MESLIYFHGNYYRHRKYNTVLENTFSIVTNFRFSFSSAMKKKCPHTAHRTQLITIAFIEMHLSLTNCSHNQCLVFINAQQILINVTKCNSPIHTHTHMEQFSFIQTFMSDYCSTAICNKPKKNIRGYWWEGSNSTVIPQRSAPDIMNQFKKIESITFRATSIYLLPASWFCTIFII